VLRKLGIAVVAIVFLSIVEVEGLAVCDEFLASIQV
jgi:hypothetical protein